MRVLVLVAVLLQPFAAHAIPVTVIGTNDLHGRVERLPIFGGHLDILRDEAKKKGGVVLFVDAGDMFQGTLASNLNEGASVIDAYNLLKPDAVAIGNHELDFGPAGPLSTPRAPTDDPQGALKVRAKSAKFPFLAANLVDEKTKKPIAWPNVKRSILVTKAGIKIGIIGVTTKDTPFTTIASNFKGLEMAPLRESVAAEADALRAKGAAVVVVAAHAGGKCTSVENPSDSSSCDLSDEVFQLAGGLPAGLVDVIIGAHTHAQIAHVVSGTPVIESWANGKGFGRVDLDVDPKTQKATLVKVHAPHAVCVDDEAAVCVTPDYEGRAVNARADVEKAIAPYVAKANTVKHKKLGVKITNEVKRGYDTESALGNLFADLMLEGRMADGKPGDVALMNGGGIRANLPAGDLTYGQLFEMMPFDNRFAFVKATGADLRKWLEGNYSARKGGILSVAGVNAVVACDGKKASVTLTRADGRPLPDDEKITIVTSDFLAMGGEATKLPAGSVTLDEGEPIRETLARSFEKRGGVLDGEDRALFDPSKRRIAPGRCKDPG